MRRLSIALLLAAGIAGCGTATSSGSFHGAQASVAKALDDYSSAAQAHDTAKICSRLIVPELANKLGDCRAVFDSQLNAADTFDLKTQSISINGSSAQAQVKSTDSGRSRVDTVSLVLGSDRRWRISSLAKG